MIYHIADKDHWLNGIHRHQYKPEGFDLEGFIHCSDKNQILRVANFLFIGNKNLIILEIDEHLVEAPIKYEGETQEKFPHIYGQLNTVAVRRTHQFLPQPNGQFLFPDTLGSE